MTKASTATHKCFALVLSGGGARGLSHAGVLRALIARGYIPSAVVGVSMGAVVGATYALNDKWYDALVGMDTSGFPATPDFRVPGMAARIRGMRLALLAARDMYFGWGSGARTETWGRSVLSGLTKGKNLQDGRIPAFVCATDMLSGQRVVFGKGDATDYVYSSAALAGILPPLVDDPYVLMGRSLFRYRAGGRRQGHRRGSRDRCGSQPARKRDWPEKRLAGDDAIHRGLPV